MKPHIMIEGICNLLIILFVYTALSKLLDYSTFRLVLKKSPLLKGFASAIAIALPLSELVTAILLFMPGIRLKGLYASAFLLAVFTGYLIYMVAFLPDLPCNCGGVLKVLSWKQHIVFNLFWLLLSIMGIFLYAKYTSRERSPP